MILLAFPIILFCWICTLADIYVWHSCILYVFYWRIHCNTVQSGRCIVVAAVKACFGELTESSRTCSVIFLTHTHTSDFLIKLSKANIAELKMFFMIQFNG